MPRNFRHFYSRGLFDYFTVVVSTAVSVESAVTEVESTRVESATATVESAGSELEQLTIAIIATSAKAKSKIDFFMFLVIFVFNLENYYTKKRYGVSE